MKSRYAHIGLNRSDADGNERWKGTYNYPGRWIPPPPNFVLEIYCYSWAISSNNKDALRPRARCQQQRYKLHSSVLSTGVYVWMAGAAGTNNMTEVWR